MRNQWNRPAEEDTVAGLWNVEIKVSRERSDGTTYETKLHQKVLDPSIRGSTLDAAAAAAAAAASSSSSSTPSTTTTSSQTGEVGRRDGWAMGAPGNKTGSALLATAALSSPAATQNCVVPPAGLVNWWPGDGSANDIVGGNNGTLQNGATFAAGFVGQAFSFDGVDDTVDIPAGALPNVPASGQFSVELWMNPASAQHAALRIICSQSLHRAKQHGMMGHDHLRLPLDRFRGDIVRQCETRQHTVCGARGVADQQADIVPLLGEIRRREAFEKGDDFDEGGHSVAKPQAAMIADAES